MRELRRNLRSIKGVVMSLLFLLGGAGASLIYIAVSNVAQQTMEEKQVPAEAISTVRTGVWSQMYNPDVGQHVADSPSVLIALFKATLWFIPFMSLVIGFEQISADVQHRTLRYTVLRSPRSAIVVGKALAVWTIVSVLVLLLHSFVWTVTLVRGDGTVGQVLSWGARLWLWASIYTAAYAGLTILASCLSRYPIICLFLGLIGFSTLAILDIGVDVSMQSKDPSAILTYLGYLIPDHYEAWLLSPHIGIKLGAIAILLGYGAIATAGAAAIINRKDV